MRRDRPALVRRAASFASILGLDLRRLAGLRHGGKFLRQLREYRSARPAKFPFRWWEVQPVLSDYDDWAGATGDHYFHQDLWAARRIFRRRPAFHLDIGSRLDGFVAHLLTFMPVTVVDVRPIASPVDGLTFVRSDATRLDSIADGSVESLSSLHAVEHFGLGRYGDPVSPDAWRAAMRELARVLRAGGWLYFSVPVGRERVEFNAHRVFSPATVLQAFSDLKLVSFAAVDDEGAFHADAAPSSMDTARYACGLFEFTK